MALEQRWPIPRVGRLVAIALAVLIGLTSALGVLAPVGAAAQPRSPSQACIAGETSGERIDNIIAILIGYKEVESALGLNFEEIKIPLFAEQCPGAAVLTYIEQDNLSAFLGLPPDEMWDRYENNGESLAEMAVGQGVNRTVLLGFLDALFLDLIGRAMADGVLNDAQGQRAEERVIPQFGWLVDWGDGTINQALGVAGGDVNMDTIDDIVTNCVPGDDSTEQTDNLVKLMLGLPVVLTGGAGNDTISTRCGSVEALGIIAGGPGAGPHIFGASPEAVYQEYLTGEKNLLDIAEENGVDAVAMADGSVRALKETLDAEVEAGLLTAEERDRIEAEASLIIVVCLKHYKGEPLPNDFTVDSRPE